MGVFLQDIPMGSLTLDMERAVESFEVTRGRRPTMSLKVSGVLPKYYCKKILSFLFFVPLFESTNSRGSEEWAHNWDNIESLFK